MRFAFYKGRGGGWKSRLIGWAIRMRTNGLHSHVEAVFPFRHPSGKSLCFSSSEMDGGSRFTWIGVEGDPNWTIVEAPALNVKACMNWCKERNGKPYDWRAIVRFALGIPMTDNGIDFCSESQARMVQDQGLLKDIDPSRVSPEDFYYLCIGGIR